MNYLKIVDYIIDQLKKNNITLQGYDSITSKNIYYGIFEYMNQNVIDNKHKNGFWKDSVVI